MGECKTLKLTFRHRAALAWLINVAVIIACADIASSFFCLSYWQFLPRHFFLSTYLWHSLANSRGEFCTTSLGCYLLLRFTAGISRTSWYTCIWPYLFSNARMLWPILVGTARTERQTRTRRRTAGIVLKCRLQWYMISQHSYCEVILRLLEMNKTEREVSWTWFFCFSNFHTLRPKRNEIDHRSSDSCIFHAEAHVNHRFDSLPLLWLNGNRMRCNKHPSYLLRTSSPTESPYFVNNSNDMDTRMFRTTGRGDSSGYGRRTIRDRDAGQPMGCWTWSWKPIPRVVNLAVLSFIQQERISWYRTSRSLSLIAPVPFVTRHFMDLLRIIVPAQTCLRYAKDPIVDKKETLFSRILLARSVGQIHERCLKM